jgi:hypothetical protein
MVQGSGFDGPPFGAHALPYPADQRTTQRIGTTSCQRDQKPTARPTALMDPSRPPWDRVSATEGAATGGQTPSWDSWRDRGTGTWSMPLGITGGQTPGVGFGTATGGQTPCSGTLLQFRNLKRATVSVSRNRGKATEGQSLGRSFQQGDGHPVRVPDATGGQAISLTGTQPDFRHWTS